MNQQITKAIVLKRTNYGEADRILTLLTHDHGKLAAMARGVRKERSKLAGGVELFSVSEVGFLRGRGDIATLTTTRLVKHFDKIVTDIDKTMAGYQLLKLTDKVTEEDAEADYFATLQFALAGLNQPGLAVELVQLWFSLRLLGISGHAPNLRTDNADKPLLPEVKYDYDTENMVFISRPSGNYGSEHIKLLRFITNSSQPTILSKIKGAEKYLKSLLDLVDQIRQYHLRA